MSWPAVKLPFEQEAFRKYVAGLSWPGWRPSKFVWHNTAAPTMAQWRETEAKDRANKIFPGTTRIGNLERYFRDQNGWSGAPHLFVDDDVIWVFNDLRTPGVHSPSYNSSSIGIEMIADFDREDDDAGPGLLVKNNTIFATAILCAAIGIEPSNSTILLHKQDPKTTHDCPGKDIAVDKGAMVAAVQALMGGGEHSALDVAVAIGAAPPPPAPPERNGVTTVAGLQFRSGPGVNNEATGSLPLGTPLVVLGEAANGTDKWLRVKTPAGFVGWVSGRYVRI